MASSESKQEDRHGIPDLLLLVAVWSLASAFLWCVGLAAAILFAYPFSPGYQGTSVEIGDVFGMVVGTALLLAFIALSIMAGVGLLKAKRWARIAGVAASVTSLFLVPLGTVAGTLCLLYLLKSNAATPPAAVL